MKPGQFLETDRLILRRWRSEDLQPFAELNADHRVMEFFPALLSLPESEAMMKVMTEKMDQQGFGFWAAELKEAKELIGFVGLNVPGNPIPTIPGPCVEIGWRLAHKFWGRGLAQESARESLRYGFENLGLKEIISFTATHNVKSRRVMERLGMTHNPQDDFDHAKIPEGHPLRRHVLYRIRAK